MPGNPVRRKPEVDLSAIPGHLTPEESKAQARQEKAAMQAYLATMPKGDILDVIRTPFNVIGNSMAGLGAEMIGKGKQFEAKYGYMPKTQAEMKALEAMMAVMGPPMDLMDYLKIPPIVGPNTPTIAAAMQGVDRAAARLTAEQAKRAAANAGQAVKKAATSDDMAYAIENLAQKAGFGPKQIMMGENSKTWNHGNAALAKHMELQGADPMSIWEATGTFRGADGKLRQEIPDWAMAYTPKAARQRQTDAYTRRRDRALASATTPEEAQDIKDFYKPELKNAIYNLKGKMSEFVDHPELRAAYPELFDRPFKQLEPDHPEYTASQNTSGFFNPTTKEIVVNGDFTEDSQRDTVLHELQHAIQQLEGWQGGSSPGLMAMHMADRDALKYAAEKENELLTLLAPKAKIRPLTEQSLKDIEGKLEKYKQLEGIDDPFKAYERAAGEEEARAVERRSRLSDEDLKAWHPSENYDSPFSEHITDFATGGAVMMSKGGVLGALAKTAEKGMEKAVKAAKADIPPMGINVRTDSKLNIPFADLIVDGQKVYESRKSDSLRPYVNKSMSIVRTGKGPAKAIGSVEIGEPMVVDAKTFREMQDKHLVPEGSMFDIEAEGQKYLYPLSNSRRFDQELDVGHGIKARKVILPDDMDKKKGGRVTIDEFLKRMKEK